MESYDLFSRWQGVLSMLHAWGHRVYFMLLRRDGETHLYLGAASRTQNTSSAKAAVQLLDAANASMPGIDLQGLDDARRMHDIQAPLRSMRTVGAVTGIPSFVRENDLAMLQTLDQLAFGIQGKHKSYALIVMADPLPDDEISDIINRMRALGSEIHKYVSRGVNEQQGNSESKEIGLSGYMGMGVGSGIGRLAGWLLGSILGAPGLGSTIGGTLGMVGGGLAGRDAHKNVSVSFSRSVSTQFLDKFAQYAEELTDRHIERLKQGRNLGFWNAGCVRAGRHAGDHLHGHGHAARRLFGKRELPGAHPAAHASGEFRSHGDRQGRLRPDPAHKRRHPRPYAGRIRPIQALAYLRAAIPIPFHAPSTPRN